MPLQENVSEKILAKLDEAFREDKIPAKLIEDGKVLTVMIPEKTFGLLVYGDIFFPETTGEGEKTLFLTQKFDVKTFDKLRDEQVAELLVAVSMKNSSIPLGGYAVELGEKDGEDIKLSFKQTIPLPKELSFDKMYSEAETMFYSLLEVLDQSAKDIIDHVEERLSSDEFIKKL